MFPHIQHIDDVLPHIEGREEFIVAERDFGFVVNYMVNYTDTFDIDPANPLTGMVRRECRGIIFNAAGKIMSRPFHKFFNIGERDETQPHLVDMSKSHQIVEKMDGSMIRPILLDGKVRLATKMGITDVALQAEQWLYHVKKGASTEEIKAAQDLCYTRLEWLKMMLDKGITPIFEWVSPENQIVIKYKQADLVYLCSRNNITGEYFVEYQPPFTEVNKYSAWDGSINDYIASRRGESEREGDVIWFADGTKLKMKTDWYVGIHKTLDEMRFDRNIIKSFLANTIDDVYAKVDADTAAYFKALTGDFEHRLKQIEVDYERYYQSVVATGWDRKQFAINWLPAISKNDKFAGQYVFGRFDNKDGHDLIMKHIEKHLTSNVEWDKCARWMGMTINKQTVKEE